MQTKILIVVPYVGEYNSDLEQLRKLLIKRAGVEGVEVLMINGEDLGWIGTHNKVAKEKIWDWYIYCPSDYFPGRDYIKIALDMATKHNKLMVGFNDGKWHGKNATAGMVHKDLIPMLYNGTLLYPGYKHHGSDPDISEKAMLLNEFIYAPEALLVEIDYTKDFISSSKRLNKADVDLFMKRRVLKFPRD
jgi:hypothetical protein